MLKFFQSIILSFVIGILIFSTCYASTGSLGTGFVIEGPIKAHRLDNSFVSLANGVDSTFINPAGIMKIKTAEFSFGYNPKIERAAFGEIPVSDTTVESSDPFKAGIYFTDNVGETSTNELKERKFSGTFGYTHGGGITNFGAGFNFGGIAFGVSRQRPNSFQFNFSSYAPVIYKNWVNFYNSSWEGFSIQGDGNATYDGHSTTYPLWSGFLTQEGNVPVASDLNLSETTSDKKEISFTLGANTGPIMWGINIVPVVAEGTFANTGLLTTTGSATDMAYYIPNFDPNDSASVDAWFTTDIYSTEAGYTSWKMRFPPNQPMYDANFSGVYSASTVRFDIGMLYEAGDWFSFGAALENMSGAKLNFKGKGVISYVNTYISTKEPEGFSPSTEAYYYDPFLPSAEAVPDSKKLDLPIEHTVELPKILRVGGAIKVPFLIAVDWERYLNDIVYDTYTLSELSFLHVGLETRLFALPILLRGDSRWLLKPTIRGITDPKTVSDINDFFAKVPAVPTELNGGIAFMIYGGELGFSYGENHFPFLALYGWDLSAIPKEFYYDVYLKGGPWQITYTAVADPYYTISESVNVVQAEGEFGTQNICWTHTVSVNYRF